LCLRVSERELLVAQEKQTDPRHGYVFNIQRYSLHDGPGIRTLVFLKGCPLRCPWCSNPESQRLEPELAYNENKCIGFKECSYCVGECPNRAISERDGGRAVIERGACDECFRCVESCPSHAIRIFGKVMSVDEVLEVVEADGIFYARSGGGITLSGGEPLFQAAFAGNLLREAKRRRINTSMETCGFAEWEELEEACRNLDSILYDIKSMDSEKHKQFVGVSNAKILENFRLMCEHFPNLPKRVRTPVIPGFNDSEKDLRAILEFIQNRPGVEFELLTYHRLGQPKYGYLGRDYHLGEVALDQKRMRALEQVVKDYAAVKNTQGEHAMALEPCESRSNAASP
jgi:pyruvate formate lyase activating enzyme